MIESNANCIHLDDKVCGFPEVLKRNRYGIEKYRLRLTDINEECGKHLNWKQLVVPLEFKDPIFHLYDWQIAHFNSKETNLISTNNLKGYIIFYNYASSRVNPVSTVIY